MMVAGRTNRVPPTEVKSQVVDVGVLRSDSYELPDTWNPGGTHNTPHGALNQIQYYKPS